MIIKTGQILEKFENNQGNVRGGRSKVKLFYLEMW